MNETPPQPQQVRWLSISLAIVLISTIRAGAESNQSRQAAHHLSTAALPTLPDLEAPQAFAPHWIADAVFYQVFPERFRNGDPSNDPTLASLDCFGHEPKAWALSRWTADWYARDPWEVALGKNFYGSVFHRRYGGDLKGVLDKLGYLQDLGITAIYFNPLFHAPSLHKYDATMMHHVDPYFGPDPAGDLALVAIETEDPATWHWTAADKLFLELIAEMHRRGMRVIIDGVFNHTGRDFFAFADLRQHQAKSRYRDWYVVRRFDDPATGDNEFDYEGWWNSKALPVFADNMDHSDLHPGPKQYVLHVTRRWMDPDGDGDPNDGVDGWRLDVPNEVPLGFWAQWNRFVRELNPEAYTVGEYWQDATVPLTQGGFSATMNYYGFAYPVKGFLIDGKLSAQGFVGMLTKHLQAYSPEMQRAMQNLIDSHDTDRVASMIVNASGSPRTYVDPDRFDYDSGAVVSPRHNPDYALRAPNERERAVQRLVALMQMTFVGPPVIYYGTEAGMWGADDPCNRQPMVWADLDFDAQASHPLGRPRVADPICFDEALHSFYRDLARLRSAHLALRRGEFAVVAADDAAEFVAFRRSLDDDDMLVAINRGDAPYVWQAPGAADDLLNVMFATSGNAAEIVVDGGNRITIPPLTGVVITVNRGSDRSH